MRRTTTLLAAGILVLAGGLARGGSQDRWLHIWVQETQGEAETVRVNVPMTLLESVAPLLEDVRVNGGRLKIGNNDLDAVQLRRILEAVKKAPDTEFVTVESTENNIVVSKAGEFLLVKVRDDGSSEKVDIRFPLSVVDALLSAPDGSLNLVAALRALGERDDGDLVTVTDRSSQVRIWIDAHNTSK